MIIGIKIGCAEPPPRPLPRELGPLTLVAAADYLRRDVSRIDAAVTGAVFDRRLTGSYNLWRDQFVQDQRGGTALDQSQETWDHIGQLTAHRASARCASCSPIRWWADVIAGPGDGWATDAADGDDENEDPDLVLGGWYDYDFMTHVLTPRAQVVRTAQGNAFKLEILAYYDDAGTSGMLTIRWAPLIAQ
jgi:hypothetical protein